MLVIKTSKKENLKMIAVCHKYSFPDSLSSKMGINYLTKMIEWYISDDKKFLFHIEENGECLGYCGGMINDGTQETGSASGMIQYSFNHAVKAILFHPWLLFHKELLEKYGLILKNIKRKFSRKKIIKKEKSIKKDIEKMTGLVVIGVTPKYQGKGYGTMLLKEFEERTKRLNIKKMALTVRNDNFQAIKSYEMNGWIRSDLKGNSLEMIKVLQF